LIRSVILLLYGLVILLLALRSLRQMRLKERYALMFLLLGLPFLLLAVWPQALDWLSLAMNMDYRSVLVLLVVGFMVPMFFELLSIVSVQERKITNLAQLVGILMAEREQRQGSDTGADPSHAPPGSASQPDRSGHDEPEA
jgi:hypothetical protein